MRDADCQVLISGLDRGTCRGVLQEVVKKPTRTPVKKSFPEDMQRRILASASELTDQFQGHRATGLKRALEPAVRCFGATRPLLAGQKGRVRKRNSTLLTRRSSVWKLPMGASDTEFDRLSRKHPAVLISILFRVPMVHF